MGLFVDFDSLISFPIMFNMETMSAVFIHGFYIAIHRAQLFAENICPESKYGIAVRAIVDFKIPVMLYGGIRIGIHKPLRVFRQNLTRNGLELTTAA